MDRKKEVSGTKAVAWWVVWIVLTIVSFFVSSSFWTPWIARTFGTVREGSTAIWWVIAVFGTWMLMLVPLIVVMYSKVDKAYEDARYAREAARTASLPGPRFRSVRIARDDRSLPRGVRPSLKQVPRAVGNGQLVTLVLKDGRKVPHAFVVGKKELLGVYGKTDLDFRVSDVVGIEGSDLARLPVFKEEEWLRLDGAGVEART